MWPLSRLFTHWTVLLRMKLYKCTVNVSTPSKWQTKRNGNLKVRKPWLEWPRQLQWDRKSWIKTFTSSYKTYSATLPFLRSSNITEEVLGWVTARYAAWQTLICSTWPCSTIMWLLLRKWDSLSPNSTWLPWVQMEFVSSLVLEQSVCRGEMGITSTQNEEHSVPSQGHLVSSPSLLCLIIYIIWAISAFFV